jgi:hypothetical protein
MAGAQGSFRKGGHVSAMPLHTLPLATTTPFTPWGRPAEQDAKGWTQALALAASASLPPQGSCGPNGQSGQAQPAALCVPPRASRERHAIFHPAGAPFEAAVTSCAHPGAEPVALQPEDADHRAQIAPESGAPARTLPDSADETPDVHPGRPCPAQSANSDRSPVRIHVEQHAAGLAVWLGVDGGAVTSARVAAALDRLRTDARIVSLVCNGIPLHDRSRLPKEAP